MDGTQNDLTLDKPKQLQACLSHAEQVLDGDMLGGAVQMRGKDVRKERVHTLGHVYWAKYNASTMYAHDATACPKEI